MPVSTLEKAMWETVQEGCYATGRAGGFVPRLGGHQKGQVWAIAATALLGQLEAALESLQDGAYDTISEYLQGCYTDNYVGTMHSLQQQGIPIITPIDQNQVVKAVQTDSKISKGLYTRLEEDVTSLKKNIAGEMSRGIATGSGWLEIATRIAGKMTNPFDKILNNAIRIARTEGHRIQQEAQLDALQSAKSAGADIVKQWDATLDARTRPDHQEADGQIVELDEEFTVGGEKLKAPGVGGSAKNVVNCRCCMLQRARWALDEAELETLKERAEFFGLDKTKDFSDYKSRYLSATGNVIVSGAISGGLNPDSEDAERHATRYYESVRHMTSDVGKISTNTGWEASKIQAIKQYVFVDEHDLDGELARFYPSYRMAQSWQRLIDGKNIENHDITLLNHEYMELSLVRQGYSQDDAHIITSQIYNYDKESREYYDSTGGHNKN